MRKFLDVHAEYVWVFGLTMLLLLCAYFPIYRNYQRASTDRYYFGAEEFPIDQIGNLAYVQEGYHGDTLASFNISLFVGRHPSIVKNEYVFIGHLARILRIEPITMFRLSQFVLSLIYIATVYILIRSVIHAKAGRIVAFAFVLFGWGIVLPGERFSFPDGVVYDALVFVRMTLSMPHYLLGGICSMLSVFFLSKSLSRAADYSSFAIASIFGICTSFFYAPNSVLIVSGFPLYVVFSTLSRYLQTKRFKLFVTEMSVLFAYAIIVAIPIMYVRYIFGYYWQDINTAKLEFLNPFILTFGEYSMALGATYLLALCAIPVVVKKGNPMLLLFATWTIMHPFGEFFLSKLLHLNPIRYFLTPYFIVFGVLSGVFVTSMASRIRALLHARASTASISIMILVIVIGSSVLSYQKTFRRSALCFCQADILSFGYPQRSIMESIQWLATHTKPEEVVLSGYHAGMLIPAFSGNIVYVSWWYKLIEPPSFPLVLDALAGFYRETVSDEDALAFLKKSNISYIFYSQEEHELNPWKWGLSYPFLKEAYAKGDIIIYSVKNSNY